MQCANHPDAAAAAYCSNCGKALCSDCFSPDKSPVLCDPCEQERTVRSGVCSSANPSNRESVFWKGLCTAPSAVYARYPYCPAGVSLLCWASSQEWVRFAMETT